MSHFEKVNSRVVKVPLSGGRGVVARRGSMLGYDGDARFRPIMGALGGSRGLAQTAGRALAGEHVSLMAAAGSGHVYYGHAGLHVHIVELDGSTPLTAEADRVLVRDDSLTSTVEFLGAGGVRAMVGGAVTGSGLFTSQLTGRGTLALLSHGGVLELPVHGQLGVDPQAYVGHTGTLRLEVTTLGAGGMFRDAVGHGSGESIQLKVTGTGTVLIQASEQKF